MKIEPNAPAFPWESLSNNANTGLTKRELMATMICAGMAKSWNDDQSIAQSAIELTDALIAELNKEQ